MAEPKENVLMEKIVSLCKRRGFIYQSSEIYGGINGFWDYGPMGAELKRNVKEAWWNTMTRLRDDVVGLDATIIMSPLIWKASGHVDTFSDPMCDCLLTKKRFRADQVEPQSGIVYHYQGAFEGAWIEAFLAEHGCEDEVQEKDFVKFFIENVVKPMSQGIEVANTLSSVDDPKLALLAEKIRKSSLEKLATLKPFSVLLPKGKPPEAARKVATQFYNQLGVKVPLFADETREEVTNSTRFNPENGAQLTEPRPFNLMLQTYVGPIQSDENVAYLRPETAQAIFAQFKNVHETSRQKIPFGIAQIGKAFRNEVTPRNFTFRSREFEQMELEFFIKPDEAVEAIHGKVGQYPVASNQSTVASLNTDHCSLITSQPITPQPDWGWQAWHQYWVEERVRFYEGIGLSRDTLGFHIQTPEELAHYARATTDILYKFPFSKADEHGVVKGDELEGIAARSDFDLSQHQRHSGKPMGVFDEELRTAWGKLDDAKKAGLTKRYYEARFNYLTKSGVAPEEAEKQARQEAEGLAKGQYIPHVIEPSAGADRLILALIASAYSEVPETDKDGKVTGSRVVLRFHPRVAPIKVAVYPLLKNKPELVARARSVYETLRRLMKTDYDEGGSIGRRYARQDEVGTPFGVTIDFDTLGEKPELLDTVTVRHRDDGRQERIAIAELPQWLLSRIG